MCVHVHCQGVWFSLSHRYFSRVSLFSWMSFSPVIVASGELSALYSPILKQLSQRKSKLSVISMTGDNVVLQLGTRQVPLFKAPTLPQKEEHRGAIFLNEYVSKWWLPSFLRNSVLDRKTGKSLEEDLYTFQRSRERVYNDRFKVNVLRKGMSGTGVRKKFAWSLANLWGVLRSSWSGHRHSYRCGHLNSSGAPRGPESSHSCGLNYCC